MKVLLLGSNGQLGWELQRTCPAGITLMNCDYPKIDLGSTASIHQCIEKTSPDWIINAAAYTAVDRAEVETDLAYRINYKAVEEIAKLAEKQKIHMVHISTDFIFSGKNFKPYLPEDTPCPESVYGKSKLKGEQAVSKILAEKALIIRTAWLYSSHGNNFVKTMLTLMAEKKSLNVIDEQIGTPTWAYGLAKAIWTGIKKNISGTFHWTDAGVASWYDFAVAIQEEGIEAGLLDTAIQVLPVKTDQYPTPAKRPMYGVLDKTATREAFGIFPIHWRKQLRAMLKDLIK
ncbi:MAG: dTDP-4-dehydrorhamnose reductase [Desulfobacula sp.]|jgi:dTDP-4-dehydrorhamnose reductase|nr:dTDP-4-dehydrorhamnose reductase [Desulfobacula sp.]